MTDNPQPEQALTSEQEIEALEAEIAELDKQIYALDLKRDKLYAALSPLKQARQARGWGLEIGETLRVTEELLALPRNRSFMPHQIEEWRKAGVAQLDAIEQRGNEVVVRLRNDTYSSGTGGVLVMIAVRMKQERP